MFTWTCLNGRSIRCKSDLFRIFDEDDDGQIHAADLVEVLTSFGDKLTKSEARKLVQKAHKSEGGLIDYQGDKMNY